MASARSRKAAPTPLRTAERPATGKKGASHLFRAKVVLMGSWRIVEVPRTVSDAIGLRGPVPIVGTVGGDVPLRATLLPRGNGRHCLVLNKQMRDAAGIALGDRVAFDLRVDDGPRVGPLPDDLADALDEQGMRETFGSTGPGMRRQWLAFIDKAVQETTRAKRVAQVVELTLRRHEARIDRDLAREANRDTRDAAERATSG